MNSRLKKAVYRKVRYNPWVEYLQNRMRPESEVRFDEIDLIVPAGPGDIIIDAGANVGDITSRCARTGATIHAFEPNPSCFGILKKRFAHLANVQVHNLAVMDRACCLTLFTPLAHDQYDDVDTTVAATLLTPESDSQATHTIEVQCIDMAGFIRDLDQPVKLLKMDIEGAEIPVLNQMIDTGAIDCVQLAIVETHERLSHELADATEALRQRLRANQLDDKVRLDWI